MTTTSTITPEQFKAISHIATQADVIGLMLSVIGILPATDHQRTLATCSSLANEIASKLAALVGGAA